MITSCSGCRVLRKGCSENCLLRQSLNPSDSPQSQSHATLFLSKFFGRAPLLSLLSSVPPSLRPVTFQSLLYEACGRTINPVTGVAGLMYTGNWNLCQMAVETVLRGGKLTAMEGVLDRQSSNSAKNDGSEGEVSVSKKRVRLNDDVEVSRVPVDLDLHLMTTLTAEEDEDGSAEVGIGTTVSFGSDGSGTTSYGSGARDEECYAREQETNDKGLRLFC